MPAVLTPSKRQQIMDEIILRMQTIRGDNVYETDIGVNVFDHKAGPFSEAELPGMDVRDTDQTERQIGADWHRMTITIQAISSGDTAHSIARSAWADVTKAVAVDPTWNGYAEDTGPVSAQESNVQVGEQVYAGARLSFVVEYATAVGSPYELDSA